MLFNQITIEWDRLYFIILYFIIYSICGWILESVYKSILEKKLINSGFLRGPYCPIYGFGTMIMIAFLSRVKWNIILLFITSFVVLSFWEYIVAIYLEKVYNTKYWDYSNKKINIHGRVCLLNSIYWGVLGVVFIKIIHPYIISKVILIDLNNIIYIDIIIGLIMSIDFITTSINNKSIFKKLEKIRKLNEIIKEKMEEITNDAILHDTKGLIIEKLQLQHNKMKFKLYKQLVRMKRAFPTMKSDKINNFLNQKIELQDLKKKIKEINLRIKQIK